MRLKISMALMESSVVDFRRLRPFLWLVVVAVLACAMAGCADEVGGESDLESNLSEPRVLSAKQTKQLLRQLLYQYEFRVVSTPDSAGSAVAGQVTGRHRTKVNFGIALGRGDEAVPVPRAGTRYSYAFPNGGFIFTSDLLIEGSDGHLVPNPQIRTRAQENEASEMTVAMTDKLCLAATSEHCPP